VGEESVAPARLVFDRKTKGDGVYEQPSLHLELAKLKHRDYEVEASRARLAAQVEREPSEALGVIKSVAASIRSALSRRRPVVSHTARLEPAL
jgi:hypothetical protein